MSNKVIAIREETAKEFLPQDMRRGNGIDLQKLSKLAKDAIEGSDASLATAKSIAEGSWWERFFKSGEMQRHVIQSITQIRDISKVNLGLSAICNDLAAASLEHANRIDKNYNEVNQKLHQIQSLDKRLH